MEKKYFQKILQIMLIAPLWIASTALTEQESSFFTSPLKEYKKPCWHNAGRLNLGIIFVTDAQGKPFVVKCHPTKATAIHDVLGGRILKAANIPGNEVMILPKSESQELFIDTPNKLTCAKTLHTHVPGREVAKLDNMPHEVNIRSGLSQKTNLHSISHNKDLSQIVASIIYLNNDDAHRNNIFFDSTTNRFFIIDQGNIFHNALSIYPSKKLPNNLLATQASEYAEKLRAKKLSPQEIAALESLDETLQKCETTYPANKIYDEWMGIAQELNYEYSPARKEYIKRLIDYNCAEVKTLRSHLDTAISNQKIAYSLRSMAEPSKKAQRDFWRTMHA